MESLEAQIAEWRAYVANAPGVNGRDVDELEDHLRHQIAELNAAGLTADEGFLIAVKRLGDVDGLSREFAREHSGRLWKQLLSARRGRAGALVQRLARDARLRRGCGRRGPGRAARRGRPRRGTDLARRATSACSCCRSLPATSRTGGSSTRGRWALTAAPFAVAALVVNVYPWDADSATEVLVALHLPVVLWFAVAYPYMGGTLRSHERRMDFVRFTGEWFIYYVLIALGGGVLMGLTAAILEPTGVDVERIAAWVLPSGAAGAVIVAAWLVESKQRVVENMAPVLTMLFTPLFAVMLAGAAVVYAATGLGDAFDRDLVGVFDALLLVVLGLVLYGMSARDPSTSPDWMDRIQLVAVVSALVLDLMVLGTMIARIGDLGFTPEPDGGARPQPRPPREPRGGCLALRPLPHAPQHAAPARAVADHLPSRLRPVGGHGRGPPPAVVRLRLIPLPAPLRSAPFTTEEVALAPSPDSSTTSASAFRISSPPRSTTTTSCPSSG